MANPRLFQEPSYRYVNISSLLWSLLDGEIAHYRNEKADPLLMESPSLWIDQQTADTTTARINIEVTTHPPPVSKMTYIGFLSAATRIPLAWIDWAHAV